MKKALVVLAVWVFFNSGKVLEFQSGDTWKWSPGWAHSVGLTILDKAGNPVSYIDTEKDDAWLVTNDKPVERKLCP